MPTYNMFTPYGPTGPHYNARYSGVPGGPATPDRPWDNRYSQDFPDPQTAIDVAMYTRANPSGQTGVAGAPVFDANLGMYVNSASGRPYSGRYGTTGQEYVNGQPTGVPVPYGAGATINPNDPTQRYRATSIEKNPQVSSAAQAMADSLTRTATQGLQNFNEYKKNFTDSINRAQSLSNAATDIGPVSANLRGLQSGYSAALDAASQRYNDVLANTKAAEQAIVKQGYDYLPMYDAAAQAAANEQMAALQRNIGRYKSASGTPMGLGSSEQQMLLGGARQILVPMEQAKIQQRYNVLNQLAMPSVLDLANRQTAKVGTFDPMVAAAQFQSGTATEQTIQQLASVASQMAYQDAIRYMQSLGVPEQLQQQIMSGNIQNAGALNAVFAGSRYQGLQDILGANITPSQNYNFLSGGYPGGVPMYSPQAMPGYVSGQSALGGRLASNAAVFPGSAVPSYAPGYTQSTATPFPGSNVPGWQQRTPAAPVVNREKYGNALGTQSNSRWDSALGALVDKTTGQITGYGASGVNLPYY